MKNKKDILLSLWICISFIIAVIGIVIIGYVLSYNNQPEIDMSFWIEINKIGYILTIIGSISTIISLLIIILTPHLNAKNYKLNLLTLIKIFAILIVIFSITMMITNISLIEYEKSIFHKIETNELIKLTYINGIFNSLALYAIPFFLIIETIFIFISTKKLELTQKIK